MRVAILGCGYVGIALAGRLVEEGHSVVGVRRTTEAFSAIEATGATATTGDITDPDSLTDIPDVDSLVVAASAAGADAGGTRELLVDGLADVIRHFVSRNDAPERVVYTSTTGVYGNRDGDWVDETTQLAPTSPKTAVFAEAELVCRKIASANDTEPVVARLGGVYGPGRYRIEPYLEKPIYPGYRNLVHRADVAGALTEFATKGAGGHHTVLVVDDEPVDRPTFVRWLAGQVGIDPPPLADPETLLDDPDRSLTSIRRLRESKRCDNARLRSLGYDFAYPTFREGYAAAVREYRAT